MIIYKAIGPSGETEWIEEVNPSTFGSSLDIALATFLSNITWMDQW